MFYRLFPASLIVAAFLAADFHSSWPGDFYAFALIAATLLLELTIGWDRTKFLNRALLVARADNVQLKISPLSGRIYTIGKYPLRLWLDSKGNCLRTFNGDTRVTGAWLETYERTMSTSQ